MEQRKNLQCAQKDFLKQPVMCPWITAQPYPSSLFGKNRNCQNNESTITNHCLNKNWSNASVSMDTSKSFEKSTYFSMQQSSSQFFHFLRLMQLFPHTHPATLHTVLFLCKNDFFCAVDKLLYAKRCKMLYTRRQNMQQRPTQQQRNSCNSFCTNKYIPKTQKRGYSQLQNTASVENKTIKLSNQDKACSESGNDVHGKNDVYLGNIASNDMNTIVEPVENIKYITIKPSIFEDEKICSTSERGASEMKQLPD